MLELTNTSNETDKELLDNLTKPRETLEVIKDKNFGEFVIYKSANAWWTDTVKVKNLITCFKNAFTVEQAYTFIGISETQWTYFNSIHPDFCRVKQACAIVADAIVLQVAHKGARENPKLAMWWLDKRGFFDKDKPKVAETLIQNNIQINNGIQAGKIEEIVSRAVRNAELEFARERQGENQDSNNTSLETQN